MSNLKFLLDENIPKSVMNFLKSKKISVEYVPRGAKNSKVAEIAKEKKTLLYPPEEFYGIVVFKIHPPKPELLIKALSNFIGEINDFKGKLFIIGKEGFKVIE